MATTRDSTIKETTRQYLKSCNPAYPPSFDVVASDLINQISQQITTANLSLQPGSKWSKFEALTPSQIADIMMYFYHIRNIDMLSQKAGSAESEYTLLAIYMNDGEHEGIYRSDENEFKRIMRSLSYNISDKDIDRVLNILSSEAPVVKRTENSDLCPLKNGILDYKTKRLISFSPEYIFTSKACVNYNPNVVCPVITEPDGTSWTVDGWMNTLSDDKGVVDLLWKLIGATLRPFVPWNKAAWFYSDVGNNGKGTLCALMKNILGEAGYVTIQLSEFSKDFILEGLIRSNAIITDENDVGVYIDKAAVLKSIITGDSILINRKFKQSVSYMFRGMMIQCVNELPRVKDKSDSFYRRQLVVPFTKCFTGMEKKYIKEDYLARQDVLEYVVYKVLNMDYYELPEPDACKELLDEYKAYNDPIRQFVSEVLPRCKWDLLPFKFLYDLYQGWFNVENPSGTMVKKHNFRMELESIVRSGSDWYLCGTQKAVPNMIGPEPLILEYGLKRWINGSYTGGDFNIMCSPELAGTYEGIMRFKTVSNNENEE